MKLIRIFTQLGRSPAIVDIWLNGFHGTIEIKSTGVFLNEIHICVPWRADQYKIE